MGGELTQLLRLPLFLKIIAIILIVGGLLYVIHFAAGPANLLFGCGEIALGVGILLRKKWAWYLTLGTAILGLYSACALCLVLYTVWEGTLLPEGTRPAWLALSAAFNLVYGGFVLYYFTRPRIRAVFGVYSTRTPIPATKTDSYPRSG
jgi:hypothetical protein